MTKPSQDAEPIEVPGDPQPQPAPAPMIGPRLDDLGAQIAFHREQETFHAQRVAFHEAERARHQQAVQELAQREASLPQPAPSRNRSWFKPPAPGRRPRLAHWVARMIEELPGAQPFTASSLTEMLNPLCAPHLPSPIERSQVSIALRRFVQSGHLRLLQRGTSHREAVYGRQVG
jgi:hypothetical protein